MEGDWALAEVERGEEEGAVPSSNYQNCVPGWRSHHGMVGSVSRSHSRWRYLHARSHHHGRWGGVPARDVWNLEEAGLLGAWGEGREQVTYHVRKLVLREYWNEIGICFQTCVGVEVQIDKVPWKEPLNLYSVQDAVVHS